MLKNGDISRDRTPKNGTVPDKNANFWSPYCLYDNENKNTDRQHNINDDDFLFSSFVYEFL